MGGLFKSISVFFSPENLRHLNASLQPYIKELQEFRFSFTNPVFGLAILIAFFILSRFWDLKKSFSYCLIVSSLLYLATKLASHWQRSLDHSGLTSADVVKSVTFVIIAFISIYYLIIKND